MNIKVFFKKIWILFLLLIAEGKHGGCSLFSFDAQHGYYSEHQRNNEQCFPYFPLTLFRWAIISVSCVWKKKAILFLLVFLKENGKKEKRRSSTKGKKREKRDVCHSQPSNALAGHWAWTAGSFSGNWSCPGVFQELPELNCCGRYFPDTDHPFISTAAQCARDVPVILLPFAAWELGINSAWSCSGSPGKVCTQEGRFHLMGEQRCLCHPPGWDGHWLEREIQQQKGMCLQWLWIALHLAEGQTLLKSYIYHIPHFFDSHLGAPLAVGESLGFQNKKTTLNLEIYLYFYYPHILPVQSPVHAFSFLADVSSWSTCVNQSKTKMCRQC